MQINNTDFCIPLQNVNSEGLFKWFTDSKDPMPLEYKLPFMHLRILIIFITTQACQFSLKYFGFSPFVSQIIAGIILSPSVLGGTKILRNVMFSQPAPDMFFMLLQLSFSFFLFLHGVKGDIRMIFTSGRKAWALGMAVFLPTHIVAYAYASSTNLPKWKYFAATLQSFTSYPVISSLLNNLKLVNTELGRLAISSTLICDSCGVVLLVVTYMAQRTDAPDVKVLEDSAVLLTYIVFLIFVGRQGMLWVIRQTPPGKPVKDIYIYMVIATMFATSLMTTFYADQTFFGAYLFGVIVPDGPPFGSAVVKKIENFSEGLLLPMLTTTCMMMTDFSGLFRGSRLVEVHRFAIILTSAVYFTKLMGSFLVPRYCNLPLNHAVSLALIMSHQGIFELNSVAFGVYFRVVPRDVLTIFSLFILVNTAVVPNLLRVLYNPLKRQVGYEKRNIMDLKPNSDFKILACVHRPDNISSIQNLLDLCRPTIESPISANILHLVELVGQVSPVFISHQLQKNSEKKNSYSSVVVRSFSQYEVNSQEVVSMNIFTAVSPVNVMSEDICTLALDKVASLIVLPFHRKWSMGGVLETDSTTIRTLNCSVLEKAPCTVVIKVDHGRLADLKYQRSSEFSYHIRLIFVGGNDDWEALSLARRMARDPHILLTVVHLSFAGVDYNGDWGKRMDNVMMNEVKSDSLEMHNLMYIEENASDGVEIAKILQPMVVESDIFIVGRRHISENSHTKGLPEWSEFPELGVLGDLLASADFNRNAAVLIVQQQNLGS